MANAALDLIIRLKDEASKGLGAIGASMGALVTPAGAALVAIGAIGAGLTAAVGVAADYESTMNRFASVTGSSITEAGLKMSDFNALALQMGAKTQFSAGEAATAMVELAKGGIDPATIAGEALAATLDLAAAGQIDLAVAAEITAKQLGVWSSEGVTATEVADKMAQAANASTVDVDELAMGMAQVGGVAKVAGLSFEETTQAMALLAPGFASASDAGTSFKAFLNNLIPTTEKSRDAMAALGLATEDGKSKFYDAEGAFIGMEAAAKLLNTATAGLTEEQKTLALETIFGSDAQRAAALIAEQGAEGYNKMGLAMDSAGTAAEQAAILNQGFNFALESLKGSLETIAIVIGTAVLPVITALITDGLIPVANAVLAFVQGLTDGSTEIDAFGGEFATIFSAIQLIVETVMPVIQEIITTVLSAISEFWNAHGEEIMAWVQTTWDTILGIISLALILIQEIIVPVLTAISEYINTHGAEIQLLFETTWTVISSVIDLALAAISTIITIALALIKGDTEGALKAMKEFWETFTTKVTEIIEALKKLVAERFEEMKKLIVGAFKDAYDAVVKTFEAWVKLGSDIVQSILDGIKALGATIATALGDFVDAAVQGALQKLKDFIASIQQGLSGGADGNIFTPNVVRGNGKGGAPALGSGGDTFVFNIDARGATLDEQWIERAIERAMAKYGRRTEARIRMA